MDELDQIDVAEITPGGDVQFAENPYIAAVFNALVKYQTCSGIIISRDSVLAGGYCVMLDNEVVDPVFVSVLSGVVDFRDHEMDQWRYAVSIRKMSRTYRGKSPLVLIKLNEPFFENFSCGIVQLKTQKFVKSEGCTVISWRFHDELNRLTLKSLVLKKTPGYVMNKTICSNTFRSNPSFIELDDLEFICINFQFREDDRDFDCMGADGSILLCEENGLTYPAGIAITYYGESRCNRAEVPNVFLDVGSYYKWMIDETSLD